MLLTHLSVMFEQSNQHEFSLSISFCGQQKLQNDVSMIRFSTSKSMKKEPTDVLVYSIFYFKSNVFHPFLKSSRSFSLLRIARHHVMHINTHADSQTIIQILLLVFR